MSDFKVWKDCGDCGGSGREYITARKPLIGYSEERQCPTCAAHIKEVERLEAENAELRVREAEIIRKLEAAFGCRNVAVALKRGEVLEHCSGCSEPIQEPGTTEGYCADCSPCHEED